MNTEPTYREAFSSEPDRKPQGFYIDQMKSHANAEIANEDATSMRCSTFTDFELSCIYIGANEHIRKDRVYPALGMIGYNWCYHDFKSNMGDVFSDISSMLNTLRVTRDRDVLLAASTDFQLFTDVRSMQYRVTRAVNEVALKQATESGVKTSDLNLYHALHGLKVIIENEPAYIFENTHPIIDEALRTLRRADKSLLYRQKSLKALMTI